MKTIATKIAAVALLVLIAVLSQACPLTASCPLHAGSTGSYVGTRIVTGILVGVYHCSHGENFEERCN